jgi:zinc transport system ATP-binding protein
MEVTPDSAARILLEVKDLCVRLDGTLVVHPVSFVVHEGEFVTILGPNGSGKSVLVKALVGLLPHEGEVLWHRKSKIGYLPQGLNQMTVRDMPLTVKEFFALKKLRGERVTKYLALVGLRESVLEQRAGYLSSGEFQRMLVAWVLASEPNVLFLDEPTNSVDVAGGQTIHSLLGEVWRNQKLTIFTVTHDLNIVFGHSTHVLCLSRALEPSYGVPKEVLTPERLRAIYGADIKFHSHV